MAKTKRKKDKLIRVNEEETEEMIRTWDIVTCKYCGKEISMLDARFVQNGQFFVCNTHRKQ